MQVWPLAVVLGAAVPVPITVRVESGPPAHILDPHHSFVGLTLDAGGLPSGFAGLSLGDERLVQCTRALGPGLLRIGGGAEDYLAFEAHGRKQPALIPSGLGIPPTSYFNASSWEKAIAFAARVDLDVIFGLNAQVSGHVAQALLRLPIPVSYTHLTLPTKA